ncbi:MAG: type 4a pilus biogenesis protein PilO [Candidatus Omnitrophica bacterium]|nr:type 4a pilus biogenesis protein PilO [Candidatus Omnitrophota bacterium]MCM8826535.1 type 4a pilus biogenesis protein PilO [Candidatus Omnitrophota bacterium]
MVRTIPNPPQEIEKIRKALDELNDKAVSQQELPRIIQQLISKSSELKIEIISIKPRDDIRRNDEFLPKGVSKAYVEMIVKCPYRVLGEYLKALSDLPIIFTIESMRIERAKTEKDKIDTKEEANPLIATLILSTYTIWQI